MNKSSDGESVPNTAQLAVKANVPKRTINPLAGAENNFPPAILTKKQAALYLQATTRFLERAIKSGRLRAVKLSGKFVRIRLTDLERFIESGATMKGGE